MNRYAISREAEADLDAIYDYVLESSGHVAAQGLHDEFLTAFHKVAEHPGFGHRHHEITDSRVRVWSVHSYLIIYSPESKPLAIARIVHGARDIALLNIHIA